MRNKKLIEKTKLHKDGSSTVLNIALEKEGEKSYCNTGYLYLVTHPSTNLAKQGLTFLNRRNMLLSLWYSDSTLNTFFLISKIEKVQKKHIWYCMAGKVESKKLEEYENENYYLLWWSDKLHFSYNSLGLSGEDNSVSRTDNFVIVNVTSSCVTGKRNFARKEELIYQTITALTSNTTCPIPAISGDSHAQYRFMAPKYHSLDAPWSLGRKSVFCAFLRVLYQVCNAQSAFYTRVHILYPVRKMLSPRFIPECVFCFVLYFPSHAVSDMFFPIPFLS